MSIVTKKEFEEAAKPEYFSFPEEQQLNVGLTRWTLNKVMAEDFNDKNKKVEKWELKTVIVENKDGKINEYSFNTYSKPFIKAVMPYLADEDNQKVIFLSIMRVGKGAQTKYIASKSNPDK